MINKIAIIGGTGKEGKGLAYRWAKAGFEILIGSRQIEKALFAAEEVRALLGTGNCKVNGEENLVAAKEGDIVVLTVPYEFHIQMLNQIKSALIGKIIIDVTVPLVPPKVTKVQMPAAGSAAQEAKSIVDESTEVVSAFQNISYERLLSSQDVGCDVMVCGSSKEARRTVIELVQKAGMVGFDAGPIENSAVVEGLTSILIGINKEFGVKTAGIKIIGI
jgi:8-hydroxy-5-deazaflavin:NADPH oxidoreductase